MDKVIPWFSDQLRLHTDLAQADCQDFSTYVVGMDDPADQVEFCTSLMTEVPASQLQKILKELARRKGATGSAAATITATTSTTNSTPPTTKKNKPTKGRLIMSTVQRQDTSNRRQTKPTSTTTTTTTATNAKSTTAIANATNNKTTAHNPFLTGENPAEFVCNCLRCGQIIWYNEPTEKKCHSGRTKDCYNLWVDACDPETGDIDVDYALTKKARKKNRRAREDRERRNNTGGGASGGADKANANVNANVNANANPEDEEEQEEKKDEPSANLLQARERVQRLVKYDAERLARSQVYDDQSDYFADSTSTWLTPEEKQNAAEKDKVARRAKQKRGRTSFAVDFAGRRIVDTDEQDGLGGAEPGERMLVDVHVDARTQHSNGGHQKEKTKVYDNVAFLQDEGNASIATAMPLSQLYGRSANVYSNLMKRLQDRAAAMDNKNRQGSVL